MLKTIKKTLIPFLAVGFIVTTGVSQTSNVQIFPKFNSPYSRFGIGELSQLYFNNTAGMGGITAANIDPYHLNIMNPASLTYLEATSFELGLYGKYTALDDGTQREGAWGGNLQYLALGFPLINPVSEILDKKESPVKLGMSFSLQPFSDVGYNIEAKQGSGRSLSTNVLKGDGGSYIFNWGNGIRYKEFSFGVNTGYVFGKSINSRQVSFDSLTADYITEFYDDISIRGFRFQLGGQYKYDFKKTDKDKKQVPNGKSIILGATIAPSNTFSTNSTVFNRQINSIIGEIDTLQLQREIKGDGKLPAVWTMGVTYQELNRLKIGVEYTGGNWSTYTNDAKPESLLDSRRIAVGVEYIPDHKSYNKYYNRVRYRIGFYNNADPRSVNGEQLQTTAATLGAGFPIILPRQQTSFVNVALEAGKTGIENGLNEWFGKIAVGFALNDNSWFFKRKFN